MKPKPLLNLLSLLVLDEQADAASTQITPVERRLLITFMDDVIAIKALCFGLFIAACTGIVIFTIFNG